MDISSEKAAIHAMTRKEALDFYVAIVNSGDFEAIRWLGRNDRFFLLGVLT